MPDQTSQRKSNAAVGLLLQLPPDAARLGGWQVRFDESGSVVTPSDDALHKMMTFEDILGTVDPSAHNLIKCELPSAGAAKADEQTAQLAFKLLLKLDVELEGLKIGRSSDRGGIRSTTDPSLFRSTNSAADASYLFFPRGGEADSDVHSL